MSPAARIIAIALSGAGVLGVSTGADAHHQPVRRTLMLEPVGPELHVLVGLDVADDKAADAMIAMADLDRNGRIEGREHEALKAALVRRALYGLKLIVGSKTSTLSGARAEVRTKKKGRGRELMLYGTVRLPKGKTQITVRSELGDVLELVALHAEQRQVRGPSQGRLTGRGLEVDLPPGDQVRFDL